MEEAKMYLRGEKQFSDFQDLSLNTGPDSKNISLETNSGPGHAGDVGHSVADNLDKVVTALNGTLFLYIPKAGLQSF